MERHQVKSAGRDWSQSKVPNVIPSYKGVDVPLGTLVSCFFAGRSVGGKTAHYVESTREAIFPEVTLLVSGRIRVKFIKNIPMLKRKTIEG